MSKLVRNNWICAFSINIIILIATLVCTDVVYETNDDYVISLRIVDGYPFSSFVNYFLCRILIGIQTIIPGINAFVVVQIVLSLACFICITRVFIDSFKSKTARVIAVLILAVFAGDHYSIMQFTKTSALLLTAGMLLLIHAMLNNKNIIWYIIAFVFIYLGTWLRDMNLIVAIGSAGIFLIAWIIINRKEVVSEGYLEKKRIIIYIICLLLICGAVGTYALSTQINKGTSELAEFSEYDVYRSLVTDYPVYEDYCANSEKYEQAGFSENDLYLINNWYLDYDGAASLESLKKINKIYLSNGDTDKSVSVAINNAVKGTIKDIKDFNRRGMHVILICLLFAFGLAFYRPRYCLYLLGTCIFAGILYCYLYYVGRPLYRATYVADIGTIVWMLYFADGRYLRNKKLIEIETGGKAGAAICIACAVMMLVCQMPIYKADTQLKNYAICGQAPKELSEFIDSNQNDFFVFGKGTRGLTEYYKKPLCVPEKGYQKNALGFGSWGTKSPYLMNKLAAYDLNNTFSDIVNNDKVFVFEDKNVERLTEYMNKWYKDSYSDIEFDQVNSIAGHSIWRATGRK